MWYNIPLFLGTVLLIAGLYFFRQTVRFIRDSDRAVAEVIEIETVKDSDGDTFRPIFRFRTFSGQEVILRSSSTSRPAGWSVGDQANVAYKADNPEQAIVMTYFRSFGLSVVLLAIAMPMLVIGGGYHLTQHYLR